MLSVLAERAITKPFNLENSRKFIFKLSSKESVTKNVGATSYLHYCVVRQGIRVKLTLQFPSRDSGGLDDLLPR